MPKLMVVDDDQLTRDFIKGFFEQRKYHVVTAESGEQALEFIPKEKPDLVLLDVNMGGMDGIETLKAIKKQDRDIVVIMVTVASDDETRQRAQKYGADDFVTKPIYRDYLEGTVMLKVAALIRERKNKDAAQNPHS